MDKAELAYRALIADLSNDLPHCSIDRRDVKLDAADLAIIIAWNGGAHFVAEALNEPDQHGSDAIDTLTTRVTLPLDTAIQGCGVAVVKAVHDYAARIVIRDVYAHRDEQSALEGEFWGDVADRERDREPVSMFLREQAG